MYDVDEFNSLLQKNCKPYLQLIKSLKHPFIREMTIDNKMGIKQVRQDRQPKGTDRIVFRRFNDWLQKNGHNRRDNSAIASFVAPGIHGWAFYIFPMGKFNYTWIEAKDVNIAVDTTGWKQYATDNYNFDIDKYEGGSERLKKSFKDYFTTDSGYDKAARNGYEIWFNCKQYLFVQVVSPYEWDKKTQTMVWK